MNLKFWKKQLEKKSTRQIVVPIKGGSWIEEILRGSGTITAAKAMQFYETCSAIATAVDLISESVQSITPVLKDVNGEYITDHPVLSLLDQPNGFQNYDDFIGDVVRNWLLKHDSHIIAYGNTGYIPIQLFAAKPFNVTPIENQSDGYANYYLITSGIGAGHYKRIETGNRLVRFYDNAELKELYHIKGFSSKSSNIEGTSPLSAAALEAKQIIKGKYHNLKLLENGGRLSLVIAFKGETPDEEEYAIRKERIIQDLTGDNAGGIAVTSAEDVSITEVGKSNKDMDFAVMDEIASKVVYQRYRIPLPLVSNDAATYSNFEKALEALYDWAVLPTANKIFSSLSKFILPRAKIDPTKMWITYDPEEIQALRMRRLNELKLRKDINVETINEMRQDIPNRESIQGGDSLYIPANLVPVGTDIFKDTDNA